MISVIPAGNKMKDHFETLFKQEVSNSTNLEQVEEFYWLVRNNCDIAIDSESDESLYDESYLLFTYIYLIIKLICGSVNIILKIKQNVYKQNNYIIF